MRKFQIMMMLAIFISATTMGQALNPEKTIDKVNYTVTQKAASQNGTLSITDGTYNRISGDVYTGSCGAAGSLSGVGTSVYYDVYEIHTTVAEAADISISSAAFGDSYITLYCSFNPLQPTQNIYCANDDYGAGFLSAFDPSDNYMLAANTSYYLVVTSFGNGVTGNYTIDMGGNLVFGAPGPVIPLSNWAFALIGVALLSFIVFKFRK